MVPMFMGKAHCSLFTAMEFLEHGMKVVEMVLE